MSVYDLHSQISGVESKLVQRVEALESRLAEIEDYIQQELYVDGAADGSWALQNKTPLKKKRKRAKK